MTDMQVWQQELSDNATLSSELEAVKAKLAETESLLMSQGESVSRQRSTIEMLRREVDTVKECHRADIELISQHLLDEAEDRDWCEQFDDFVESINRKLHIELTPRATEHDVEFVLRFTVQVTARDMEEATEQAWEFAKRVERYADGIDETDHNSTLELDV